MMTIMIIIMKIMSEKQQKVQFFWKWVRKLVPNLFRLLVRRRRIGCTRLKWPSQVAIHDDDDDDDDHRYREARVFQATDWPVARSSKRTTLRNYANSSWHQSGINNNSSTQGEKKPFANLILGQLSQEASFCGRAMCCENQISLWHFEANWVCVLCCIRFFCCHSNQVASLSLEEKKKLKQSRKWEI